MDTYKVFYFKNILLIMLAFMAISTYMIISPSGIDLIFNYSLKQKNSNELSSNILNKQNIVDSKIYKLKIFKHFIIF